MNLPAEAIAETNQVPNFLPVNFHGDTLHVFEYRCEPHVILKPVVESIGLTWQAQHSKLIGAVSRWRVVLIVIQIPGDNQKREVLAMPVRKLPGWLSSINPSRVSEAVRDRLIDYQNECDEALWNYWNQRHGVNLGSAKASKLRLDKINTAIKLIDTKNRTSDAGARRLLDDLLKETSNDLGLSYQPDMLDEE